MTGISPLITCISYFPWWQQKLKHGALVWSSQIQKQTMYKQNILKIDDDRPCTLINVASYSGKEINEDPSFDNYNQATNVIGVSKRSEKSHRLFGNRSENSLNTYSQRFLFSLNMSLSLDSRTYVLNSVCFVIILARGSSSILLIRNQDMPHSNPHILFANFHNIRWNDDSSVCCFKRFALGAGLDPVVRCRPWNKHPALTVGSYASLFHIAISWPPVLEEECCPCAKLTEWR